MIAVWQLGDQGRRIVRRAHKAGHWHELTSNVYAAAPSEPTEAQWIWAAAQTQARSGVSRDRRRCSPPGGITTWRGRSMFWCQPNSTPAAGMDQAAPDHAAAQVPQGGMPRTHAAQSCLDAVAWCRTDREAVFVLITALKEDLGETPRFSGR